MKRPKGEFHEIDKYRLDKEWVNQPRMTRYYNEQLAKAKKRLSLAKAAMKVEEATLNKKVRKRPKKYGLLKITEDIVKQTVILLLYDPDNEVQKELIDAEYEVNMLLAATKTCEDRKDAVKDLVRMFFAGYFADSKLPEGITRGNMDEYMDSRVPGVRPKKRKKGRAA